MNEYQLFKKHAIPWSYVVRWRWV